MKQKIILTFLAGLMTIMPVFVFATSPSSALAQQTPCTTGQDCAQKGLGDIGQAFPGGAQQQRSVADIARMIINWALYLAAIIAVIFLIYGGFLYITSAGDQTQAGKGRSTLTNAIIGLAIIVLSYLIIQIVYNFLIGR